MQLFPVSWVLSQNEIYADSEGQWSTPDVMLSIPSPLGHNCTPIPFGISLERPSLKQFILILIGTHHVNIY